MAISVFRSNSKAGLLDLLIQNQNSIPLKFKLGEGEFSASIVHRDENDYQIKLANLLKKITKNENEFLDLKNGIFFSSRKIKKENVALIFPGQGSQYAGMHRNEYHQETFEKMCRISKQHGLDLESIMNSDQVNQTENAQPALAAISYAMLKNLQAIGLDVSIVAGHSFGELAALAYSEALSLEDLMEISIQRGQIMASANRTAPGKMLAVLKPGSSDWRSIHKYLRSNEVVTDEELANINSPTQIIYSGHESRILNLQKECERLKIKNVMLNASAAFHSPLMKSASLELSTFLKSKKKYGASTKSIIFSNGIFNPQDTIDIPSYLSSQLTSTIDWVNIVKKMKDLGIKLFIEVGPKTVLSKLVKEILPEDDYLVLPMDKISIEYIQGFLCALGIETIGQDSINNKIIKGFIQKQKLLIEETEAISNQSIRDELKEKILFDTEEVLNKFFSIGDKESPPKRPSNVIIHDEKSLAILEEISRLTGFTINQINLDARFDNELYLDSITKIELLTTLSEKFKTNASDITALLNASSPREVIEIIKLKEKKTFTDLKLSNESEWIKKEISNYTGIDEDKITITTRFNEDLMLDSLIKMDLLGGLQANFPHTKIDLSQAHRFNCLSDFENHFLSQQISQESTNSKTSKSIRERLATHLKLGIDKILTTSDFEHDLKMNIFEKEDFINTLIFKLPYLQMALRELLHTKNVAEMLEIEKVFDRRSLARGHDEEIIRYVFDKTEIPESELMNQMTSSKLGLINFKNLDGTPSKAIADYLTNKGITLHNYDELLSGVCSELLLIIEQTWGMDLEQTINEAFNFLLKLDHLVLKIKNLELKIIILGKNRIAESLVSLFKSFSKENPIKITMIQMENSETDPNVIPWSLLQTKDDKCRFYFQEKGRFYIESSFRKEIQVTKPIKGLENQPHILLIGGARGIAAEISKFLADNKQARLSVLGRTFMGDQFPYSDCMTDQDLREKLKQNIDKNALLKTTEERVLEFNKQFARVNNQREIWKTKSSIESRGGEFHYYQVDATKRSDFEAAIKRIEECHGPIDGIIHAAGTTKDNLVKNKPLEDFKEVFNTKVCSALNMFEYFKNRKDLSFVCLFSSLSSWSGAPGQTDYAWANELLNLIAKDWNEVSEFPVSSILWSVWSETGLADDHLLSRMKSLKLNGITNSAGIRLFREEILNNNLSSPKVLLTPASTLNYSLDANYGK